MTNCILARQPHICPSDGLILASRLCTGNPVQFSPGQTERGLAAQVRLYVGRAPFGPLTRTAPPPPRPNIDVPISVLASALANKRQFLGLFK